MIFCSNCGNPANPNAKFCECCGTKITVPHTANPEDATSCFLPEGGTGSAPEVPYAKTAVTAEPSPFAQAAAAAGPSPFAQAAAAHANEPSPYAAAMAAMAGSAFTGANDGTSLSKADSLFADPADFADNSEEASSFMRAAANAESGRSTESAGSAPGSANGPIWLTAKPEEPKKPQQPFFATSPDAVYHAPEESIPMPAAPVPNVPIWLSRQTDLPEDLDGLTLDDIEPQSASPVDEVSWRAKRSGPVPPKKGLS